MTDQFSQEQFQSIFGEFSVVIEPEKTPSNDNFQSVFGEFSLVGDEFAGAIEKDTNVISQEEAQSVFGEYIPSIAGEAATVNHPGIIIDEYEAGNRNNDENLNSEESDAAGQSFTGDGNRIDQIRWLLSKSTSPIGDVVCKIYAHSGTFGTSSVPDTGTVHATSDTFDASILDSTPTMKVFNFPTPFTTVDGTNYVTTVEYTASGGAVLVGVDTTSPTHAGNGSKFEDPWESRTYDAIFQISTFASTHSFTPENAQSVFGEFSWMLDFVPGPVASGPSAATYFPQVNISKFSRQFHIVYPGNQLIQWRHAQASAGAATNRLLLIHPPVFDGEL